MSTWLLPSMIASFCGAVVLFGVYLYLFLRNKERFMAFWTTAWGLYLGRHVADLVIQLTGEHPGLTFINQTTPLLSSLTLYFGTAIFVARRPNPVWSYLSALLMGWIGAAIVFNFSFSVMALPAYVFSAIVLIWTAWALFRSVRINSAVKTVTAATLIAWGLHKLDYPFLRMVEWFAPFGFLLGAVLSLIVALGMLMLYYEKEQHRLIELQESFAGAFLHSASGMILADLDWKILRINQAIIGMVGLNEEELLQQSMYRFTLLEDIPEEKLLIEKLSAGDTPSFRWEKRFIVRDNRLIWVTLNVALVRDDQGTPKFFIAQVNNIQRRKELEMTLHRQQEMLDRTEKLARVGGWEVDLETRKVHWTAATKMIHEVPDNFEPSVDDAIDFYWEEDRPIIKKAVDLAIEKGQSFDLELRTVTARGNLLWVHVLGMSEFSDGKCVRLHGMFQDISESKRHREELLKKNTELERFTYTVSHDLKAPLVTIGGFVGLLEKQLAHSADQQTRSALEHIRKATEQMSLLLTELLELSRVGQMIKVNASVAMAEVVAEALAAHQTTIDKQHVKIEVAADLPKVKGDKNRLMQVLQNLIGNAIRYRGDQPQPVVTIGFSTSARGPAFFVRDNGIGIAPEYHEKAFTLFERLGADGEGTGIGLALVMRIVELHGGETWIESKGTGQGTTVWFTLPLAK